MPVPLYLDVHLPLAIAERFTGIGRWLADLELISSASDAADWENAVQHLSL